MKLISTSIREHNQCTELPQMLGFSYKWCFTTCGHYCRRWFPRSLWSKEFI